MPQSPLLRHVAACTDARLPGERVRLRVAGHACGWVRPDLAVPPALPDAAALEAVAARLAAEGRFRPRGERFAVRSDEDGACLGGIDRAALPVLGLWAHNAHLNAMVRRADGLHLWVATRAAHKEVGPGKLDHLVAGGVPFGLSAWQTLLKEAAEEAGLPVALAQGAVPARSLVLRTERPEGLRREVLHCFDVVLPEGFEPVAVDGEVAGFALWPVGRVVEALRDTEDFVFDAALAVLDLVARLGVVRGEEGRGVVEALRGCLG